MQGNSQPTANTQVLQISGLRAEQGMTENAFLSYKGPSSPSAGPTHSPEFYTHVRVHTILIIVVFCVVCFLLLTAFISTFCFRCTIEPQPQDSRSDRPAPRCSVDQEDATFRCSSSSPSVGKSI